VSRTANPPRYARGGWMGRALTPVLAISAMKRSRRAGLVCQAGSRHGTFFTARIGRRRRGWVPRGLQPLDELCAEPGLLPPDAGAGTGCDNGKRSTRMSSPTQSSSPTGWTRASTRTYAAKYRPE